MDLISKKAVLEVLDDLCVVDNIWDAIDTMPTIDAVPVVHGEWIRQNDGRSWTHYTFKCSNCGGGSNYKENFCPNCGADMRKKVQE